MFDLGREMASECFILDLDIRNRDSCFDLGHYI